MNSDQNIRYLSFNLRVGQCEVGTPNAWTHRRDACLELVRKGDYDFVGFQEATYRPDNADFDQGNFLRDRLPEFGWLGNSREATPDWGEGAPLLYNKARWELDAKEHGMFWLSQTPEERASKSWDTQCTRTLTWGLFHNKANGRKVLVANTHADYLLEHTILMQVRVCLEFFARKAALADAVLLSGDFNAYEISWPISHICGKAIDIGDFTIPSPFAMRDSWREINPEVPDTRTYHKWGDRTENRRIDYIFVAGDALKTIDAKIITEQYDSPEGLLYPSDHFPISALFTWQ